MSIISNWTNPFANKVDDYVKNELDTRVMLLSAVSRLETSKNPIINQYYAPSSAAKDRNEKALEWVYQKVAYATITPVKLEKNCGDKKDPESVKNQKAEQNKKNTQKSEEDIKKEKQAIIEGTADFAAMMRRRIELGLDPDPALNLSPGQEDTWRLQQNTIKLTMQGMDPREAQLQKEFPQFTTNPNVAAPISIKKTRASFSISTEKFKDANGDPGGIIENYGNDLYGVPRIYKKDGKYLPTIVDSPFRPTVDENGDPSVVLTSLSVTNEGVVGSVLRVKANIKVFTKEALEIIDQWLLRPGNELDIEWGWSVTADDSAGSNQCSKERLNAVIFNFSCEYREDNTWDVSVEGIAKGSLATGVSFEVQDFGNGSGFTGTGPQAPDDLRNSVIPNLYGLIKLELAGMYPPLDNTSYPEQAYEKDESGRLIEPAGMAGSLDSLIYKSDIFPHGIAQFVHPLGSVDDPLISWIGAASGIVGGTIGVAVGAPTVAGAAALGIGGALAGRSIGEALARLFIDADYKVVQRTYICLSDIVHYFNTVLTNQYFPKDAELFEIQVENSPTSYDPNIVSSEPLDMMFSDTNDFGFNRGMSTYGYSFRNLKNHTHGDIRSFYKGNSIKTYADSINLHEVISPSNTSDVVGNLGHIWISTEFIQKTFIDMKLNKGVDPRFKNIFSFFEEIFKLITKATGGAIKPSFVQENRFAGAVKGNLNSVIWIVDTNHMPSDRQLNPNKKAVVLEVNNIRATLVRNVNARLKLPGSMQSTAYTFGRAGLNDNIQTLDDLPEECYTDDKQSKTPKENYQFALDAMQKLSLWKEASSLAVGDRTVIENLQGALYGYVGTPTRSDSSTAHQGWVFSKLYPIDLSFEIDGISGLRYGNIFKIKDAMPARYFNKVYFTITKLEHTIVNHDWKLNVTAIARIHNSDSNIGSKLPDDVLKSVVVPKLGAGTSTNFNRNTPQGELGFIPPAADATAAAAGGTDATGRAAGD
jgi:hypothetical protein